jgi:hypothetical protein
MAGRLHRNKPFVSPCQSWYANTTTTGGVTLMRRSQLCSDARHRSNGYEARRRKLVRPIVLAERHFSDRCLVAGDSSKVRVRDPRRRLDTEH